MVGSFWEVLDALGSKQDGLFFLFKTFKYYMVLDPLGSFLLSNLSLR